MLQIKWHLALVKQQTPSPYSFAIKHLQNKGCLRESQDPSQMIKLGDDHVKE